MKIQRVGCDVEGCKAENAQSFSIYKERKADGAGGMENWYYVFDLCPQHIVEVLKDLLEDLVDAEYAQKLFKSFKIKTREQ